MQVFGELVDLPFVDVRDRLEVGEPMPPFTKSSELARRSRSLHQPECIATALKTAVISQPWYVFCPG